jgi:hypothetical protein
VKGVSRTTKRKTGMCGTVKQLANCQKLVLYA